MRQELREYNYDWKLRSLFQTGAKAKDGTEKEYRRLMASIPHFRDLMEFVFSLGEPGVLFLKAIGSYMDSIVTAHQRGKKLCLTTFCQSPAILYAMDVIPIVLEPMTVMGTLVKKSACAEFMDHCVELGFTETSCSSQRGALGAYLAGLCERPDFVLVDTPGICDTNANSFAFAAAYMDIPFFQLNYPPTLTDDRAASYHRDDHKAMIAFLEEQTGHRLDVERLRATMLELEKQDDLICELQDVQRLVPSPVPVTYNVILYSVRFTMGGQKECTVLLEAMLRKALENAKRGVSGLASGVENARGLFVYIDHYGANMPLWRLLEKHGVTHLGGILDRFYQHNAPYAQPGEGYRIASSGLDEMIDTLAAMNARLPMVKQIRGPYDAPNMWLEEARSLRSLYQPDFAVYMGTPGCRNTWGMVKLFAQDLENEGLPTLIINADSFDDRVESWEATANRIEEFLELRNVKKGRGVR